MIVYSTIMHEERVNRDLRSMLKRAHKGTFHKMSPKHLQRYVDEFAEKHNIRRPR